MNVEAFVLLFVIASAVAIAARYARVPYTAALVLAGLALGALEVFPAPRLTKDLLFSVLLPGLLFEAAYHIDSRELRGNWITISALAVPGVIASTALVAFTLVPVVALLGLADGFSWKHALVFGALISATDPVAVVALFRNLGAPRRLTMLLDCESLLNDGTATVFFMLSLSLLSGSSDTARAFILQFLSIVGMGAVIGAAMGAAVSLLTRQIDDPMIEITLTTIAAYGSFIAAESLNGSGVIATVAAGMLCGNVGARGGSMSASTRVAAESFWEYVSFALNSVVFLLIGFEVRIQTLLTYSLPILAAYGLVTLGRALIIALGRAAVGRTRERFPWRWGVVLSWGGLRGALPMVLALSLPQDFEHRELIVSMTFGVAVLSILAQGLTMAPLLRRLGIGGQPEHRAEYELHRGRIQAASAALAELDRLARTHAAAPEVIQELCREYEETARAATHELKQLSQTVVGLHDDDLQQLRRRLLIIERDQVIQAFQDGRLSRDSEERLLADIDARLLRPESAKRRANGEAS